ncbi:MAG: ECF transporter S component [Clostridia bacterium]|nr:ECF transporter S component [Clostridia bacterium]
MTAANSRKSSVNTKKLALMGVLTGIMVVLGYVNIPMPAGLSITFNMIPVAIAGMAMGLWGGTAMGAVFGLISFLQCFGIIGTSGMGAALVAEAPWWMSFVQRFVTRVLMGFLTALIYKTLKGRMRNTYLHGAITGFSAAFLNTLLFMSALVLLFGHTEYLQEKMAGRAFLAYIVASVGVNGLVEMATAAVLTGAIGVALKKARLI